MAKELGRYDASLQMFVEPERKLNKDVLMMWRTIAETSRRLGRYPEGSPCGDIALAMVVQSNEPIEKIMDRSIRTNIKGDREI